LIVELLTVLLKLVDDPETYYAMAQEARTRARDFTFDSYAVALRNALNRLGEGHAE
jgi:glycosyltransferase involved in cell wall biosynthesis